MKACDVCIVHCHVPLLCSHKGLLLEGLAVSTSNTELSFSPSSAKAVWLSHEAGPCGGVSIEPAEFPSLC